MKTCYWCNKSCPDTEEGAIELDPDNLEREVGWICDHCALVFDGQCYCGACIEKGLVEV